YPEPCMLEVKKLNYSIVYSDDNILVVDKPVSVEVIRDEGTDLTQSIILDYGFKFLKPMHRLDKNTRGLVIFAKNERAYDELFEAFKNRTISKFYLALVRGIVSKKSETLIGFISKNSENTAIISDKPCKGFEKIITSYKVLKRRENTTLLEIELVTGKYHQIRAHMAYYGYPLVGETRYAREVAREGREQKLISYKIVFHFTEGQFLYYLNGKVIELKVSL
ncbi:MAG: RluA family pseudouridine synthase, partial [Clostridia bacterium]